MKIQKIPLILVVVTLSLQSICFAQTENLWKKEKVRIATDSQHVLLSDDTLLSIAGIKTPDIFFPKIDEQCLYRQIFQTVKLLVTNKDVQYLPLSTEKDSLALSSQVKIKNKDIAEFLLQQGFAKLDVKTVPESQLEKYKEAENSARKSERGLWQRKCVPYGEVRFRLQKKGFLNLNFRKKYAQFLAPISVGKVKKVISGDTFLLENGLPIRMLGIQAPSPEDSREGFQCFGKSAKMHLEDLILGKMVFLRKDNSQLDEDGNLLRYVFIPERRKRATEIFINEEMIKDGYAKSYWEEIDDYYKEKLEKIQQDIYSQPCGAWTLCTGVLLNK